MTASSAELMSRAQAGDIDAFGEIYSRYRPLAYKIAKAWLPRHADDIVQDAFVKALGSLHLYRDQGRDPAAWFSVLTRNLCFDRMKSSYLTRVEITADVGVDMATAPEAGPESVALAGIEEGTVRTAVRAAVERLPDGHREALILFHLNDMSIAEVAREMGRTEGAVKALLFRGRRTLAGMLTGVAADA